MLRMGMGLDVWLMGFGFCAKYFERFSFIYIIVTIIMSLSIKFFLYSRPSTCILSRFFSYINIFKSIEHRNKTTCSHTHFLFLLLY
jgi:hypothetical protein